ncbi:sensor histidine kinase, partial [Salinivirga cyanobacteriivorans]
EVTENETMTITRGIYGLEKKRLQHYYDMFGINPIGKAFSLTSELGKLYQKGGLHTISGGLTVFSNNVFEDKILFAINKLLDIKQIYSIGLKKEQKVIAAIHIFKRHEESIAEKDMVKQIIGQAEIALQNRIYQMELEDALQSKKKFLSILAHDLKNPFTSIIGIMQLINRGFSRYSSEKLQRLVKQVLGEAQNTYNLLDNLLKWANAEQDNLSFNEERIDLHEICSDIIKQFKLSAEQKKIKIVHSIPADTILLGDYQMLHTIIRNLVSNAVKFTPVQGEIRIFAENKGNGNIDICVSDSGEGIDEETRLKILNSKLLSSKRGTQNEKGSGLGLIIVRDFIKLHNSTLKIISAPETGTKFCFSLQEAHN